MLARAIDLSALVRRRSPTAKQAAPLEGAATSDDNKPLVGDCVPATVPLENGRVEQVGGKRSRVSDTDGDVTEKRMKTAQAPSNS